MCAAGNECDWSSVTGRAKGEGEKPQDCAISGALVPISLQGGDSLWGQYCRPSCSPTESPAA
jgi:hypothetical protein